MSWGTIIILALVLVCPISMLWMMRHGRHHGEHNNAGRKPRASIVEPDGVRNSTHRPGPEREVAKGIRSALDSRRDAGPDLEEVRVDEATYRTPVINAETAEHPSARIAGPNNTGVPREGS